MTFKIICDNCGKETEAPCNSLGQPFNPSGWYSRNHENKKQHTCSRKCRDEIGGLVAPW